MKRCTNSAAAGPGAGRFLLLGLGLALGSPLIPGGLAAEKLDLNAKAREQIRVLQAEKTARTPAQRKIDSQLIHALRKRQMGAVAPGLNSLKVEIEIEPDGRVLVDLRANVTPGLLELIARNGGTVVNSFARYNAIRAHVTLDQLERLAARPEVRSLRPADRAATNLGLVTSGGDIAHRVAETRERYGADGSGVKIGVLSDSVRFLTQSQAAGELPAVTVLPGQGGAGTGEGTAMLEIVHDLAAGAQLYFATVVNGIASFAQNIRDLHSAGCHVIVDDALYFAESPLQDGLIAQAVNDVSAAGTLFFSSAGNGGSKVKNTSGTWEGDFNDGGPATSLGSGRLHDFGGATYNTLLPGGPSRVDLFWADPLGASTNDYDVFVLDASGAVVRSSTNVQDGDDDPYESIPFIGIGERLVIVKESGEDRYLSLMTFRGVLAISTAGSVRGHNASGAGNAFSVAAAQVNSPAVPFDTLSPIPIENFSSDGPRRIFFHADGSAITPGNYSATGGAVLDKPDITAADGVATTVPGFANFLGTSAAAPHAAAIAALLWSFNPLLSPAEVRAALTTSALDIEAPGRDANSGAGILMADRAFVDQPFAPPPRLAIQAIQLTDGNGNGGIDANECGDLVVTLRHVGLPMTQVFTGITARLLTGTAAVRVDPEPRIFPDVLPGSNTTSLTSFRISTSELFNCGSNADFVLHCSTSNQLSFDLPFELRPPGSGIGASVTFTAMDLPLPIPDLGTVESGVLVTGFDRFLERVRVAVYLTHTLDYDLNLSVISPDGKEVLLSAANGGAGQGYGSSCNSMTVFSDDAATSITAGTAPFVGTFRPQQPLSAFRNLIGTSVNGLWKLRVQDQAAVDSGMLHCWSLELSPLSCADGGGQCLVPPTIVQGPANQIATNGDTVQFSIQAQGTAPLTYQWFFSPTNFVVANSLTTATNAALIVSNVTPASAGIYSVLVSNFYGQQLSSAATLTVMVPALMVCGTNRTIELGAEWDFDSPVTSGGEVAVSVLSTTTNAGPGQGYSATRTWQASDTNGLQATCSQTISVVDPLEPTIACAPDKTVTNGAAWTFDTPVATAAVAEPSLVYDNLVNDLSYRFDPGTLEVGDEIILGGPAQELGQFSFEYWGLGPNEGEFAGDVQARVRFYSNDGPQTASGQLAPGTVLFDSGDFPIPATPRDRVFFDDFEVYALVPLTVALPGAFTWTVQFRGLGAGDHAGVDVFSPPALGNNHPNYWERKGDNWSWKTNAAVSMDFAARVIALNRDVTVTVLATVTNTSVPNTTVVTRTWLATDAHGHSATCAQTVNVVDTRPPLITVQPQSQIFNSGEDVFLTVTATGAVPLHYQWFFNETNLLAGATGPALGLTNVQTTHVGFYSVLVSNAFGTALSESAELAIFRAPLIIAQPASQILPPGETATFEIRALGNPALSYQWWFNETNLLTDATNAVLNIPNAQSEHAGEYAAVVSNSLGTVTSQSATLRIAVPVVIVCGTNRTIELGAEWDFDSPVASGGEVTVSVLSTTTNAGPGQGYSATRTWQASDTNGLQATCSQTILVVDRLAPTIACAPDKTVTNGAAWTFDTPVATAAVAEPSLVYDNLVNDLMYRFDPGTLEVGDEIILGGPAQELGQFSFEYWGLGPHEGEFAGDVQARVRFYSNDGPQTASGQLVPGTVLFDSGDFPIPATPRATVTLDDFEGEALVPLTLPLPGAFTWTVQFRGLGAGDHAGVDLFSPPALGNNHPKYWERKGDKWSLKTNAAVAMDFGARLIALNRDVTVTVLATVTNTPAPNTTVVTRIWLATDAHGHSATCAQTVHVVDTRPPLITVAPQSQILNSGEDVFLTVTATGAVPLQYQWYFNLTNLLAGATGPAVGLTNVQTTNAGFYSVLVSNAFGAALSESAELTIFRAPLIIAQPASLILPPGETATFEILALGNPAISCQWWFNETNLLADATNAVLSIPNVQSEHAGEYAAVVSNSLGTVTSQSATLRIGVPAFITAQPQDATVAQGGSAQFTVGAGGTPPVSFLWYFKCNELIGGADSETLQLTNVSVAEIGSYCVVVSNHLGSEISRPAALQVLVPPDYLQIARTGSVVTLKFPTLTNQIYSVQYKDAIEAEEWSILRKGSNRPGTGFPLILPDLQPTSPQRFYRVLIQ